MPTWASGHDDCSHITIFLERYVDDTFVWIKKSAIDSFMAILRSQNKNDDFWPDIVAVGGLNNNSFSF